MHVRRPFKLNKVLLYGAERCVSLFLLSITLIADIANSLEDLEISKPQRNRGGDNNRGNRRRSRSADHNRNGYGSRGIDRYTSGQNGSSPRDREFRRGRDDYRPNRSPSPRGYRDRRDRSRDRSRGRFNGRRRSRSRSPYGRNRYRSPSPRRDSDDDLPLPRRAPRDVPDVQMIVLDDLDR